MMLLMINATTITLIIMCLTSISPINMGAFVLCTALSIAANVSMLSTGWLGFITFIIYVGGMLVMFAYFAALQPNQYIISWNLFLIPSIFIFMMVMMSTPHSLIWNMSSPDISQIYSSNSMIVPLLLALILFFVLITVVKTSKVNEGPLRPFYYV